jgi:quinol monooxygenase YgiN
MSIAYVVKFKVRPSQHDRFNALLTGVLDAMRNEPMFRGAVLHRDPESENRYMLYEMWESHDDVLAVQLARPYRKAWHDALPELLEEPRDISVWAPVRQDGFESGRASVR